MNVNRKTVMIGISIVCLLVFGLYYFFSKKAPTNEKGSSPENKEQERIIKHKGGDTTTAAFQDELTKNNGGFIVDNYKYDATNHLLVNQKRTEGYTEQFPSDELLWTTKKGESIQYQSLTDGSHRVHLETKKGSPFLVAENDLFVVFYEMEGTDAKPRISKGYAYKVNVDGTIEKSYETKGVFYKTDVNADGNLVLVEKIYEVDRNTYPSFLQSYTLHYYAWNGSKWSQYKDPKFVKVDAKKEYENLQNN